MLLCLRMENSTNARGPEGLGLWFRPPPHTQANGRVTDLCCAHAIARQQRDGDRQSSAGGHSGGRGWPRLGKKRSRNPASELPSSGPSSSPSQPSKNRWDDAAGGGGGWPWCAAASARYRGVSDTPGGNGASAAAARHLPAGDVIDRDGGDAAPVGGGRQGLQLRQPLRPLHRWRGGHHAPTTTAACNRANAVSLFGRLQKHRGQGCCSLERLP